MNERAAPGMQSAMRGAPAACGELESALQRRVGALVNRRAIAPPRVLSRNDTADLGTLRSTGEEVPSRSSGPLPQFFCCASVLRERGRLPLGRARGRSAAQRIREAPARDRSTEGRSMPPACIPVGDRIPRAVVPWWQPGVGISRKGSFLAAMACVCTVHWTIVERLRARASHVHARMPWQVLSPFGRSLLFEKLSTADLL